MYEISSTSDLAANSSTSSTWASTRHLVHQHHMSNIFPVISPFSDGLSSWRFASSFPTDSIVELSVNLPTLNLYLALQF